MNKYQICAVTSTRAEYGVLRPLLQRLEKNPLVDLDVIVTGTHLIECFGYTKNEIIEDGYRNLIDIFVSMDDDTKFGMATTTGVAMCKFANHFKKHKYDLLIVLGDRYEIFAAVSVAHIMGIVVAHISGGDITEGAIDDALRHSMTKMSYLHFPGCSQSAKRIIQMGESPDRVFNVGELGVENCLNAELMSKSELKGSLGYSGVFSDYSVVTFHPVTMEDNTAGRQVHELIKAMESFPAMSYIITMSNADAGGREINDIWEKACLNHKKWLLVPSLGVIRYLSAIKYAKLVIGNSSSGIIEVPSMGTPTVNIGDRQKGRMMADSVINCRPIAKDIISAMRNGLKEDFQIKCRNIYSPFGDGKTSKKMEKIIMCYLESTNHLLEKKFYDIEF